MTVWGEVFIRNITKKAITIKAKTMKKYEIFLTEAQMVRIGVRVSKPNP